MRIVAASEAQSDFSRILDDVEQGESLLISRNGKVIACLDPEPILDVDPKRLQRKLWARHDLEKWVTKLSLEEMFSARDQSNI